MKLQVNMKGAWRDVIEFEAKDRHDVCRAAEGLAAAAGSDVKWSYVNDWGDRYYYQHGEQGKPWRTLKERRS